MNVQISKGNMKVGKLPSVSLAPIASCPKGCPCSKDCYAMKAFRQYPTARKAWSDNFAYALKHRDAFFDEIETWIGKHQPKLFRWHVGGDIIDAEYLVCMRATALLFPNTRFLVFTKRHDLNYKDLPDNLSVVFSMWPAWGNTRKSIPRAWMQNGTETRVPKDAIHCHGGCETCGMCWDLKKLGRDVVFDKH